MKIKKALGLLVIIVIGLTYSCSNNKNQFEIASPDQTVKLSLNENQGILKYQLHWQNQLLIDSSKVSLMPCSLVNIIDVEQRSSDTTWNPVWGQFSEIQDQYNELILTVDMDGVKGKLFARVYDKGLGFRFEMDSVKEGEEISFEIEHNLYSKDQFYCPAGESEPKGPYLYEEMLGSKEKAPKLLMPLVVEKYNHKYLSILESDLYAAKGFGVMNIALDKKNEVLKSYNKAKVKGAKTITPWRVILWGEEAGDLVTNTVAVNLATPCQLDDTEWIKPGKTLWDWRVHGYVAPDGFKYGINTESYKRFIDFAALKGIEYFLIDDSWYKHASKGHFELSDKLDLQEVIRYAEEKGVELILYYDRKHGEYGDEELFPYYQSLGMKGIKYGFMGCNPEFSSKAIQLSAKSKLLIDFHDNPVPFTGMQRTYPNAITREYCHAQQDSRRAFTPEAFIKMALINAIQGPMDMNNGNFDIVGINSGIREKSPRKKNSYLTTAVSEVARTLIIFSGLVCIPDAPEAYMAKEDLFEFIQKMPVGKWDESKVLRSRIGEYITTARRSGDEWFVGSVANQDGANLLLPLDFLKPGQVYDAVIYEDTEETHCKTNPEAYRVVKRGVVADDVMEIKIASGGGHCMWIRPRVIKRHK